jgi:hypothetical protein
MEKRRTEQMVGIICEVDEEVHKILKKLAASEEQPLGWYCSDLLSKHAQSKEVIVRDKEEDQKVES